MSNRKRIARNGKTNKRGEQFTVRHLSTRAVITSNGKSIDGKLTMSYTKLRRLAEQIDKALAIYESHKEIVREAKKKQPTTSTLSFSDFEGLTDGTEIIGYGYDVKLGDVFEKLGLEPSTENILKVLELVGKENFQEFLTQCIREDLKK
tara:strand:+ start:1974 stop:2420 length:447 start_codon:yes stop_codon:yes gene_type:complete